MPLSDTMKLRKIAEGREAEMFEWGEGKILRVGRGEHASERMKWQKVTLRQAAACGVRVPHVYGQTEVMGRTALVMERISGVDLLTLIGRRPWKTWWVGGVTGRLHARMHGLEAPLELEPLKERIRRLVERPGRVPDDVREFAFAELAALPDGDRLCHGDFHPGNVMMQEDEPVVIDWSNVSRGDPTGDVARTVLTLRMGEPPPGTGLFIRIAARFARRLLVDAYMRSYRRERSLDVELLRRWMVVRVADRLGEGIAEERDGLLRFVRREIAARQQVGSGSSEK